MESGSLVFGVVASVMIFILITLGSAGSVLVYC